MLPRRLPRNQTNSPDKLQARASSDQFLLICTPSLISIKSRTRRVG
jgi:hypothetical protein